MSIETPEADTAGPSGLRRLAGWLASLAILVVVALVVRDRWATVGEAGGLPTAGPIAAAVIAYLAANVVLATNWRELVALGGSRPPLRRTLWVWSASQLARYTVNLGQVAGRGVLARRHGMSATTGVVTTLLELTFHASVTATLALATLPWWLDAAGDLRWLAWVGAAPTLLLVGVVVHPRGVLRALSAVVDSRAGRWVTRGRLTGLRDRVDVTRPRMGLIAGLYVLNSSLRVAGFLVLFAAVGGSLAEQALLAVGAYALGNFAGLIAVFAPGGLGAREGTAALVLAPAIGGGPALVLVAATRLVEVVAELALLGIARAVRPDAQVPQTGSPR